MGLKYFICSIVILQFIFYLNTCTSFKLEKRDLIRNKRWAKVAKTSHWPETTIHYKFACTEFTRDEIRDIKAALQGIMDRTCLNFVQINDRSNQADYINVSCIDGGSCRSKLGYIGGAQSLNLARTRFPNEPLRECLSKRKIQHEFLHALGFNHELNSFNRDEYLDIKYENMEAGWERYFAKDEEGKFNSYGCEFDYNSVMMPPARKHTKNGQPTFVPKDRRYTAQTIGIAESISECDITRINNMYCPPISSNKKTVYGNRSRLSEY